MTRPAACESGLDAPPGNVEARYLVLLIFAASCWACAVFIVDALPQYAVHTTWAMPPLLAALALLAARLAGKGSARTPILPGVLGVVFVSGGPVFDMIATVVHTPSLEREANVFARALLDSGWPAAWVYAYAILAKGLLMTLKALLWLGLLRHRTALAACLGRPRSTLQFLKAVAGGARLSWRQFLMPLRPSELPRAYPLLWLLAVVLVGEELESWYLGLAWCGQVPGPSWPAGLAGIAIALAAYVLWLWRASRAGPPPAAAPSP